MHFLTLRKAMVIRWAWLAAGLLAYTSLVAGQEPLSRTRIEQARTGGRQWASIAVRLPPVAFPAVDAVRLPPVDEVPIATGELAAMPFVDTAPSVAAGHAAPFDMIRGDDFLWVHAVAADVSPAGSDPFAAPAETGSAPGDAEKKRPIGQEPPESINTIVARDTSLLLKPGAIQTEVGALYTRQETQAVTILPNGFPALERLRNRVLVVPLSVRYGCTEKMELFAVAPFGVGFFERDNVVAESSDATGVLGDITAGLVHQLPASPLLLFPNPTLSFNVTVPTGTSPVRALTADQATLGNGVWKTAVTLNFVESLDPFVFYGSIGYQYQFADTIEGFDFQRGDVFSYGVGAAFAASDDVSVGVQVAGFLQRATSIEGIVIPNSDLEPVSVRLSLVRRLTKNSRVQPYVDFGLTRDAPDFSLGLRSTHSL